MFYVPKTQKSFSVASILRWSEALLCEENSDWETWFVPAEFIKKGQKLYREIPHAYALNLDLWTATLIFRLEDIGDVKIILSIDKNTKRLKWQSLATVDYALRASLAVAAIYFVEEFLAEESPRITLANEEKRVPALQEHSQFAPAVPAEIPEEPKYLRLSFKLNATLLSLNAEFVFLKKNQVPVNALKKQSETGIVLDNEDRTRLAKLGLCAHKAGFIFNAQEGVYELFGMTHIEIFVREHLDYWRQTFPQIQGITNLLNVFGKESTLIDTVAKLNSVRGNAFSVKYLFSLAGKLLSEDETRLLLANRDEGIYLPKHGVVKLRSRDNALLNDCQMKEDASLPIYSLLSLFQEKAANNVIADSKLTSWKKRFFKEAKPLAGTLECLRPYQKRGIAWIRKMLDCGVHPLVADEMGLGKTLQILSVIALDKYKNTSALILCPASVVPVWENEIQKFFPQIPVCVLGTLSKRVPAKTGITLTSYGYFRNNQKRFCRRAYTYAVLDEAQFIKNPSTKIAHAVTEINAKYRIALTGTPIENRHIDLWTIFRFLMPGLLGKRAEIESSLEEDPRFVEKLRTQIMPFILRRTKEEVAKDLPEKISNILYCPLTDKQREAYAAIAKQGIDDYKNESVSEIYHKKSLNFLTLLLRLRQAACDLSLLRGNEQFADAIDSGKLMALSERVEEIVDNGGHIVIFSQFVKFLNHAENYLRERFPNVPFFTITGSTLDRATPVKEFQSTKGPAIFLISLRAGGTGLTLTSAEYVFLLDPWWNPAVEEQAIDRVHRIGQTKRVFVYRMIAAETIEDRIEKLKQSKRDLFSAIIENDIDISNWAQFYPTLESLFALKEE